MFPAFAHFRRTATCDTELHGQKIKEGDKVVLWYVSSNREESLYEEPDRFDVLRNPEHQAFGAGGRHFCLGTALARLELRILFEETLERFPDIAARGQAQLRRIGLSQPDEDAAGAARRSVAGGGRPWHGLLRACACARRCSSPPSSSRSTRAARRARARRAVPRPRRRRVRAAQRRVRARRLLPGDRLADRARTPPPGAIWSATAATAATWCCSTSRTSTARVRASSRRRPRRVAHRPAGHLGHAPAPGGHARGDRLAGPLRAVRDLALGRPAVDRAYGPGRAGSAARRHDRGRRSRPPWPRAGAQVLGVPGAGDAGLALALDGGEVRFDARARRARRRASPRSPSRACRRAAPTASRSAACALRALASV